MDEWDFVDDRRLTRSFTSLACITCQHFSYGVDAHCQTLLACKLLRGRLQDGEHLTQNCRNWSSVMETDKGGTVTA